MAGPRSSLKKSKAWRIVFEKALYCRFARDCTGRAVADAVRKRKYDAFQAEIGLTQNKDAAKILIGVFTAPVAVLTD